MKADDEEGPIVRIGTDEKGKLQVKVIDPATGKEFKNISSLVLTLKPDNLATCQIEFFPSDVQVNLENTRWHVLHK